MTLDARRSADPASGLEPAGTDAGPTGNRPPVSAGTGPVPPARTNAGTIFQRLRSIYGEAAAPAIADEVERLIARYAGSILRQQAGWSERDAFLITYGDSLLGDAPPLQVLREFLCHDAAGLLTFVHLLPFYPSSSDDGFAVEDFRRVRADLGDWQDIARLADGHRLVFDAVINHVSASSHYLRGYSAGEREYADFFVALDAATDTSKVLRTRNLPLLHEYPTHAGSRWLWTTFSRDQLDLNYRNPAVLLEILDVLLTYAQRGAAMLRLDAIPYLWKELGTSCAHLPQTHEIIKLIRDVLDAAAPDTLLLTETNVPHHENVSYFGDRGDEAQIIYNFTLPPLILASLAKGDAGGLTQWARGLEFIGPRATYLNITATHDGIGMRPTEGILSEEERAALVRRAREHGGDITGKQNADGTVSPYELNITYFDAINDPRADEPIERQVRRFMVSQAIPLALMGVPAIYIHSLLGSRNDDAGVRRTGRARSINREQLPLDALRADLANPATVRARVFAEYARWLRLRAGLSAFHPDAAQEILDLGPAVFAVRRHHGGTGQQILALHNVSGSPVEVRWAGGFRDILTDEVSGLETVPLAAYQVRWLRLAA